eukprot:c14753_g1_i1 orf=3-212(-)
MDFLKEQSNHIRIMSMGFINTINSIIQEASIAQSRDVSAYIRQIWLEVVISMMKEAEWREYNSMPSLEEY